MCIVESLHSYPNIYKLEVFCVSDYVFLVRQIFIINFMNKNIVLEEEWDFFLQAWATFVSHTHLTLWVFLFSGIGMGMTVPISFAVFPDEDGALQKKLKVWFRIPNQFQSNPPVPSDDSVKIEERENITVYSMQFGGYAKEADYIAQATQLRTALEGTVTYRSDIYFCTGYDPPMKPYGRRNEIWLVKIWVIHWASTSGVCTTATSAESTFLQSQLLPVFWNRHVL